MVEIASFQLIKKFQIAFVEKLGESIASTIANVKVNMRTKRLLEESQLQAEVLRAQEKEMRQNMEEMHAIQENQQRLQEELKISQEKLAMKLTDVNRFNKALHKLKKNEHILSGNWEEALGVITETLCHTMKANRSSVCTYDGVDNTITCLDLFEQMEGKHSQGLVLKGQDFPTYFHGLKQEQVIKADDAWTHPITKDFTEVYFKPLQIYALLDVPYYLDGRLAGVICFEHQHATRAWKDEEVTFITSVCDVITLTLANAERKRLQKLLMTATKDMSQVNELVAA